MQPRLARFDVKDDPLEEKLATTEVRETKK